MDSLQDLVSLVSSNVGTAEIPLSGIVRFFYLNAILITITINVYPPFARKLYAYGKNISESTDVKTDAKAGTKDDAGKVVTESTSILDTLLDLVARLRVPHAWFIHFYAYSLVLQLFWFFQILSHGRVLQLLLSGLPGESPSVTKEDVEEPRILPAPPGSQSVETILLMIVCMSMQSARRLFECLTIQKHGSAKMGIMIYIAGLTHYTMMSLAVFCEGIPTLRINTNIPLSHPSDLLKPPRLNTFLAIPFFFLASGLQHDAHIHLASLVKYTFPTHPLFSMVLSPHYTAECVIYGSFVVLGAPRGEWVNWSLLYVWVFVLVNQAFGAAITRAWYEKKFGEKAVSGRWGMVPYIF